MKVTSFYHEGRRIVQTTRGSVKRHAKERLRMPKPRKASNATKDVPVGRIATFKVARQVVRSEKYTTKQLRDAVKKVLADEAAKSR